MGDVILQKMSFRDPYLQHISRPGSTIGQVTRAIARDDIKLEANRICVALGNNQIPLKPHQNLGTQIRKLINELTRRHLDLKIYVCTVFPRPWEEATTAKDVVRANADICKAVTMIKKFNNIDVKVIKSHQLFLE